MNGQRLQDLRAAVKAECQRRNGYGSLCGGDENIPDYTSSEYDIPDVQTGDVILASHGRGIIDPLVAITEHGDLEKVEKGKKIPESFNEELFTYVNVLAAEPKGDALKTTTVIDTPAHTCNGACTGLCAGTCHGGCSGCSDECTGGCNTLCSGCTGCSGSCGTGCASGCRTESG